MQPNMGFRDWVFHTMSLLVPGRRSTAHKDNVDQVKKLSHT